MTAAAEHTPWCESQEPELSPREVQARLAQMMAGGALQAARKRTQELDAAPDVCEEVDGPMALQAATVGERG